MRRSIFLAAITAAVISCSTAVEEHISVVPYPNEVSIKSGTFNAAGADIRFPADLDEGSQNVIKTFADQLALVTGQASTLNGTDASTSFNFLCDASMPEEAYTLSVNKNTATIKASSLRGFNYAVQTIKQMLPAEIYGKTEAAGKDWSLQCVEIKDEPRFGYRGMHMDVSRHFFDMDMVKKYLDVMEIHKLNTLHWHLTDDQGWRVEIKQYPLLTEIGSIRKETLVGHLHRGEGVFDGIRYGEGCWFSQEQVKEIIDYAAAK